MTVIWPCLMICRAWFREVAKPSLNTTLSSLLSRIFRKLSPVTPGCSRAVAEVAEELFFDEAVGVLHLLLSP